MDTANNIQRPKGFDNITHKKDSKVEKTRPESNGVFSGSDGVEISEEAQEIRRIASDARNGLNNVPEIRETKVHEVREKLSSGFFDRPEVIKRLADKLISIF